MAANGASSTSPVEKTNRLSTQSTTTEASTPAELSDVIDELLNGLSNKFAGVSSEIFAKMEIWLTVGGLVDEMSRRLDNLEQNLQTNAEERDGTSSPTKP
ncbi:hypothetical protein LOCC1_G003834 [Lachnellula occidentalis]|uniref:Heat shock factor-binding protein n=1 Tax=Lachnellula occidentalis TaxID=215460 RepID=A0A8H8RYX9_9HELO|nr:hypothetical protein LOCC1_G003834 [Lachnellula occidentalis]